ncbi:hypothetical protein [Synechococcus sp. CS-197]|uniref:hypothetical protein n=1 Tax=Synechococcus sp. CS-197 TaxID=2847985 RepID=UPI0002F15E3E|nr:hypothetical protein [Synechococcus sp. CS-197]MCT0249813.1 hypothetical protein [Synechococcus sp. CS-197]PTU01915.1 hypothetical protein DBR45_15025 [Pseudomonas sp. HMWF031]
MSQLSIKLSDKADALVAQLQKEIFNRRRKKVTAAGVVETLVESGARSQSDKRFATSWVNLIKDIEKAAKLANAHGSKPSSLTDEEWVMVLSHRNRAASVKPARKKPATASKKAPSSRSAKAATKSTAKSAAAKPATVKPAAVKPAAAKKQASAKTAAKASSATAPKPRPAKRARKRTQASVASGTVAGRMAKAAAQLVNTNGIHSPARS